MDYTDIDCETCVTLLSTCYAIDNAFQTLLFLMHEGSFDFFVLFICMYILNTVPEIALLRNNPANTIY